MIPNYEWDNPGVLAKGTHVPAKIIMKLLYAARVARPDLLQSTCHLARFITRWTLAHDRMLNRLMSYVNCTTKQALISVIGDEPQDCRLVAYVDADHASDKRDKKSTSGVVLFLVGPNTLAPITAFSKAQSCVSHSSTESELVALDQCIRSEAVPITWFWEQVLPILGCQYTLRITHWSKFQLYDFAPWSFISGEPSRSRYPSPRQDEKYRRCYEIRAAGSSH